MQVWRLSYDLSHVYSGTDVVVARIDGKLHRITDSSYKNRTLVLDVESHPIEAEHKEGAKE